MRSKIAAVAIGLGVFMIVAAGLVRFYAYPTLATVPPDYEGTTLLEAKGAQVLNFETYQAEEHDLEITSYTVAYEEPEAPEGTVSWVNSTTVNRAEDGSTFQQTRERAPFDAVSGEASDCDGCESWTEVKEGDDLTKEPTAREGQVYKFPFGTEKKSYGVWDGTVGRSVPAKFEGTEEIDGLEVYKFVQTIEPTMIETREVPGSMFGSSEPGVQAEMWYGMTRTFFVEPETGSPVDRVEERMQELRYEGQSVPLFNATVEYTDQQVDDLVNGTKDDTGARENGRLLGGLRLLFPLLLVVVGVALLAGGLFASNSSRERRHVDADGSKTLVNA